MFLVIVEIDFIQKLFLRMHNTEYIKCLKFLFFFKDEKVVNTEKKKPQNFIKIKKKDNKR